MPRRTVFFAKITRDPQQGIWDKSFPEDILRALDPDLTYQFHRRVWRFSAPDLMGEYITAKLGFTVEGEEAKVEYDESRHDFVTRLGVARQTHFSHFVIDPASEVVAFEERGKVIRQQAFVRAFSALLHEARFPCDVTLLPDPARLAEWAREVDRVIQVHAVVHNPNPDWIPGAGALRDLIVESFADVAEVTARERPGQGLNVDAPWIQGAVDQIGEHAQGKVSAVGVRGHSVRRWHSGQRARTESMEQEPTDESPSIFDRLIGLWRGIRGQ